MAKRTLHALLHLATAFFGPAVLCDWTGFRYHMVVSWMPLVLTFFLSLEKGLDECFHCLLLIFVVDIMDCANSSDKSSMS